MWAKQEQILPVKTLSLEEKTANQVSAGWCWDRRVCVFHPLSITSNSPPEMKSDGYWRHSRSKSSVKAPVCKLLFYLDFFRLKNKNYTSIFIFTFLGSTSGLEDGFFCRHLLKQTGAFANELSKPVNVCNVKVNICWTVWLWPGQSAFIPCQPTSPLFWPPSPRRRHLRPPRRSLSLASLAAGRAPSHPCPSPPSANRDNLMFSYSILKTIW